MPGLTLPRIGGYHSNSSKVSSHPSVDVGRGDIRPLRRKFTGRTGLQTPHGSKSSLMSHADPYLSITIESPPLVCYGPPKESTGALLSGLIHLGVEDAEQKFNSFTLSLRVDVTTKQPVQNGCANCSTVTETLHNWTLITEPVVLPRGVHSYPFSYLFPGNIPASSDNALSRISYSLHAAALPSEADGISLRKPIKIERAILPGPDKHSIRIFPPTNLSATLSLPSVVHPGGDFAFDIRLDGVVNREKNTRWRLRKANWRVEENSKVVSVACARHAYKVGGSDKGVAREDTRIVGSGEYKRGWKSDFDNADGKIELEVLAAIPPHMEASCKLDTSCGIQVHHVLVVEMIVVEEYKPLAHCRGTTPTGAARVLRMQFHLTVTARSGMGISWDEEAPPMYENIPVSPPSYGTLTELPVFQYADFPLLEEDYLPPLGQSPL